MSSHDEEAAAEDEVIREDVRSRKDDAENAENSLIIERFNAILGRASGCGFRLDYEPNLVRLTRNGQDVDVYRYKDDEIERFQELIDTVVADEESDRIRRKEKRAKFRRGIRRFVWRIAAKTPGFLYVLGVFVAIKIIPSVDFRAVLVAYEGYQISLVEALVIFAGMTGMIEIPRVAKPEVDNIKMALMITATAVLYVVLFTIGNLRDGFYQHMFSNTEFLTMTIFALTQAAIGLMLNARMMKRTIDSSHTNGAGM